MWAGLASPAWATTITPTVIHEGETLTFTFDVSGTPLIGSGSHSIDYSGTAAKTTDYVVSNPSRGIIVTTAGEHLPDKRGVSYIDGVSFSADAPSITFRIEAKADDLDEGDETVNFSHEFGRATVTIKDGPRPFSEPRARPVASFDAAASSADEDAGRPMAGSTRCSPPTRWPTAPAARRRAAGRSRAPGASPRSPTASPAARMPGWGSQRAAATTRSAGG